MMSKHFQLTAKQLVEQKKILFQTNHLMMS